MQIAGSTAFVTGANRGLGRRFVGQLLERAALEVGNPGILADDRSREVRSALLGGVAALYPELVLSRSDPRAA